MPRLVNFCPYCGTGQHAGVSNPAHARPPAPPAAPVLHVAPPLHPHVPHRTAEPARTAPVPPAQAATPMPSRAATAAAPPASAPTPQRGPVRLRWWLLLLAAVLALWMVDKPRKIEARVERALALGAECKLNEAQAELISLRKGRASPEQLQRLQQGLNDASRACERKQQRAKAWRDTSVAVDDAIDSASFIKANQRLQGFIRKWGEDGETRALAERITAARLAWQNSDAGRLEKDKADCRARGGRWLAGTCW